MVAAPGRVVHYSLRHRVTASISQGLFGNLTYTVRHGLLKGMRRKGGLGFVPAWLTRTQDTTPEQLFWRELDLAGKVIWDVGAFEGLLTMYFASRGRTVIAFEPNPAVRRRLADNLSLNGLGNVRIRPVAVGSTPGELPMVVDPLMPGGGSLDSAIGEQTGAGNNAATRLMVPVVTLDQEMDRHPDALPDLLKLDIEGLELEALRGGGRLLSLARPDLFIEMHGSSIEDKQAKAGALLSFLAAAGYRTILHLESRRMVSPSDSAEVYRGHLFCRHTARPGQP